jgi:hypothetical protein
MGRSVSCLDNERHTTFIHFNQGDSPCFDYEWEDFEEEVESCFSHIPSLTPVFHRWDGRETKVILENSHAEIGISEYCGIVSVSIRTNENNAPVKIGLAEHWIDSIWPSVLQKLSEHFPQDHITRVGGFSDGTSVYERVSN